MKQRCLVILISILVLSCGQKQTLIEKRSDTGLKADTSKISLKDTNKNNETVSIKQNCSYENEMSDLGIGIIVTPTTFEIFNDSLLTNKHLTADMYNDFEKIDFCSIFYKPDYGIMHFACIGEAEGSYKVLTGFSEYKFLPKTKEYEFKTWEKYILGSLGIRRKIESKSKQVVKEKPFENSKEITIPDGFENFCPIEIKGDWIKVKYDCFYNTDNNEYEGQSCHNFVDKCDNSLTGWIKWKNKNELLIEIFLIL